MRHNTKGVVLHCFKYSDSSLIARVFTQDLGIKSFIVKGVRSKKSKLNINVLRPLSLIDMEVYSKNGADDQLGNLVFYSSATVAAKEDFAKSAITIFIAELLFKCIEEGDANISLFQFLWNSILELQESERYLNFHLVFMIRLTKYLGFLPNTEGALKGARFNINEGVFVSLPQTNDHCMSLSSSVILTSLMQVAVDKHQSVELTLGERNDLVDQLLLFYNAQLPNMKQINSHLILREVMC